VGGRESERNLGLGLPVARLIAAAHGGQLTMTRSDGGAVFIVDLPAVMP
jgi:C4-dicarboxylate-specific signal transduction histidine kinase